MSNPPQIHTYHCLCSTLLLATPYTLTTLPRRAPPSLDRAYILPLPPLSRPEIDKSNNNNSNADISSLHIESGVSDGGGGGGVGGSLPSLLTATLRPARKVLVVRREDGFEKRRVYRCGRCGVGVGYEIVREGGGEGRVIYLMEGGLVETGEMGREDGV